MPLKINTTICFYIGFHIMLYHVQYAWLLIRRLQCLNKNKNKFTKKQLKTMLLEHFKV